MKASQLGLSLVLVSLSAATATATSAPAVQIESSFGSCCPTATDPGTLYAAKTPSGTVQFIWSDPGHDACFQTWRLYGSDDPASWISYSSNVIADTLIGGFEGSAPNRYYVVAAIATDGTVGQPNNIAAVEDIVQDTNSGTIGPLTPEPRWGQTFSPTSSGRLARIDLRAEAFNGGENYPLTVSVVETLGGAPTESILGAITLDCLAPGWNWLNLDFSGQRVDLVTGQLYAIVLASTATSSVKHAFVNAYWFNPYPGGALWQWTVALGWDLSWTMGTEPDLMFHTWMTR